MLCNNFFSTNLLRNAHARNSDPPIYEAFSANKNVSNSTSRIGIDCIQERYTLYNN